MNPASLPSEELRRELEALGIARERHRLGELIDMLPARLDGEPYEDFDADCVAEVLVYLVSKGVIGVRQEIASFADSHGSPEPLQGLDGHDSRLA